VWRFDWGVYFMMMNGEMVMKWWWWWDGKIWWFLFSPQLQLSWEMLIRPEKENERNEISHNQPSNNLPSHLFSQSTISSSHNLPSSLLPSSLLPSSLLTSSIIFLSNSKVEIWGADLRYDEMVDHEMVDCETDIIDHMTWLIVRQIVDDMMVDEMLSCKRWEK